MYHGECMLRDLRWVSVAEIFSRLASIVTVPLLTRALVPAEYGIYRAVFFALSVFFLVYGIASFETLLAKRLPEIERPEQAGLIAATALGLAALLGAAWLLLAVAVRLSLVAVVSPPLQSFLRANGLLVAGLFLALPLFRLVLAVCRGIDRFGRYSATKLVREGSFLAAVVWLFATGGLTVQTALLAMLGATGGALLVGVASVRTHLLAPPDVAALGEQFRAVSLPLVPKTVLKKVSGVVPDMVVLGAFGPPVFAAWSVLFAFNSAFQLVSGPFSQLLLPKISERRADGRALDPVVTRYYRLMGVVVAPAVVGGWLLGPEIVRQVFGASYFYGPAVTGVLITSIGVQTVNALSGDFFVGTGKSVYDTYSNGLYAAVLLGAVAAGGLVGSLLVVVVGHLLANATSLAFSLWYQRSVVDLAPPSAVSLLQLAGSLLAMAGVVVAAEGLIGGIPTVLGVVCLGAVTYFATLHLLGFVSEDDVSLVRRFVGIS